MAIEFEFNAEDKFTKAYEAMVAKPTWQELAGSDSVTIDDLARQWADFERRAMMPPPLPDAQQKAVDRLIATGKPENLEIVAQILVGAGRFQNTDRAYSSLWMDHVARSHVVSRPYAVDFYEQAMVVLNCSMVEACRNLWVLDELVQHINRGYNTFGLSIGAYYKSQFFVPKITP